MKLSVQCINLKYRLLCINPMSLFEQGLGVIIYVTVAYVARGFVLPDLLLSLTIDHQDYYYGDDKCL